RLWRFTVCAPERSQSEYWYGSLRLLEPVTSNSEARRRSHSESSAAAHVSITAPPRGARLYAQPAPWARDSQQTHSPRSRRDGDVPLLAGRSRSRSVGRCDLISHRIPNDLDRDTRISIVREHMRHSYSQVVWILGERTHSVKDLLAL